MSKIKKLIMISLSAAVFTLFVLMTLLSLPIGKKGGVLPILSLYVTGIVVAALFLAAGCFLLVRRLGGLTKKGKKVYDNKIRKTHEEER
ncbi:MAG: hypothetical protein J5774_05605 [Clostridia bacterium]|nr:hypothetical protein [Clostridia bacterium]